MVPSHTPPAALSRTLGLGTAVLVVVGLVIGSGIFRVPSVVAGIVSSPASMISLWVTGGVLTLCLGLIYAELGSAMPVAGGTYVYLRRVFGEGVAFVFGWTFLLVNPASWATLALSCAEFVAQIHPLDARRERVLAVTLIGIFALANCRSARFGARLQNAATVAKILAIAAAIATMAYLSGAAPPPAPPAGIPSRTGVSAWLTGLVAVLWAYDGAAGLCSLGGELRSPQRNLPRALILGVGSVILVYVAINLGLLQSLAPATIAASPLPLAAAIEPLLGSWTASGVACLVIVSTAGTLAVSVLADPRVFMAMAQDGNFFRSVGVVSSARHTPVNAIVLHSALACVYVCVRSFEQLAATYVLGLVPFYVLVAIAAWRLRRSRVAGSRAFRAPALALLCGVWIVAAFLLIGNALADTPAIVAINLGLTIAGVPVYFLWCRYRLRRVQ